MYRVVGAFLAIALSSNCLLFFFRIRAIFDRDRLIVSFFFFLWLSVIGGSLASEFSISVIDIGPTKHCLPDVVKTYSAAGVILLMIYDGFVYFAISWRLLQHAYISGGLKKARSFVSGEGFPDFSKALFQSGQQFFAYVCPEVAIHSKLTIGENRITLVFNVVNIALVYIPGIPPDYRAIWTSPNFVVTNSMACRIFRNIKFGRIIDSPIATSTLSSFRCVAVPAQIRHLAQNTGDNCVVTCLGSPSCSGTDVTENAIELSVKAARDVVEYGNPESTQNESKNAFIV